MKEVLINIVYNLISALRNANTPYTKESPFLRQHMIVHCRWDKLYRNRDGILSKVHISDLMAVTIMFGKLAST